MPKGPIRRAQLIAPYGVGAMIVVRDGTSLITAGLDHWYEREDHEATEDDFEYRVEEWRLQQELNVNHFRLPPDFRKVNQGDSVPNAFLTVPFLRFPQWHYCQSCGYLQKLKLVQRNQQKCPECLKKNKTRYLVQTPIIALCSHGHIQDFPWREWVHGSAKPTCQKKMRLLGTGSASLGGLKVECECGVKRSLANITEIRTEKGEETTVLSQQLIKSNSQYDEKSEFRCQGKRPWLGTEKGEPCSQPLKGSLRSASNIYYAQVRSAIYLHRGKNSKLMSLLEEPPLSGLISLLSNNSIPITPKTLRQQHSRLLQPFSDEEIETALRIILSPEEQQLEEEVANDDSETRFRRPEFNVLRTKRNEDQLKIRRANLSEYEQELSNYFSRILLIDKLRETRVLTGFNRIYPESNQDLSQLKSLLARKFSLSDGLSPEENWLPAYIVYGEGIFLELKEERIREWLREQEDAIDKRIRSLGQRYQAVQQKRQLRDRAITPRLILLHTLAHLLMNQLTFECGYSSAALKERLYVSDDPNAPMAGILIYTAAGDSEGTMGGLVRMGKPRYFEPTLYAALHEARWCSADPVCMEMGEQGGQGPDSCNLAACHNCALVPETACEEFNRFLDRGLVVGSINNRELGFFSGL